MATPVVGRSRRYTHHFGGSPTDYGFTVTGAHPLHVVFAFDSADPLFPIPTRHRLIPLCYGFRFGGSHTTYRVNGNVIELVHPVNPKIVSDYPYTNYPSALPRQHLILRRSPYNPRDAEDALMSSAFFGLSHVREKTLAMVSTRIDHFGQWDDVELGGLSRIEYLNKHSWWFPLTQGRPSSKCEYPDCSKFGVDGAMRIVAFHAGFPDPHEVVMWGEGVEMVSLIFQMCQSCGTFVVSNQCM